MSIPFNYEDTLRIHDLAIYNWLRGLPIDYGDIAGTPRNAFPILSVMATPDRPFADIPNLLVTLGWINGTTAAEMLTNASDEAKWPVLPLPICSFQRGDPTPDTELSGVPKMYRASFFNVATGQWERHQWPGHYRTEYTLTFWSLLRSTDNYIREWVMSQMGHVGAGESETFIPVVHKAPWGTMRQSCKLVATSDVSDLEGDGQRYIRTEVVLSLRTWLMRTIIDTSYPIQAVTADMVDAADNTVSLDSDISRAGYFSANLFYFYFAPEFIPANWPRTGTAAVKQGAALNALAVQLTGTDDSVELVERLTNLDGQGLGIISISFAYTSDGPCILEVAQRDPATQVLTSAYVLVLPPQRDLTKVHIFTVVVNTIFNVSLAGLTGQPVMEAEVSNVDIRTVTTLGVFSADARLDGGDHWTYQWHGLDGSPVLIVLKLASLGSPVSVTVENDATAPTAVSSQTLDSAINVGQVFLTQPVSNSVVLKVPKAVALASLTLQRYAGHYNGNDL